VKTLHDIAICQIIIVIFSNSSTCPTIVFLFLKPFFIF
jgi:hypothetical protein